MDDAERARELALDALINGDPAERVRLARQALSLSELCSDAYVVLALDEAEDLRAAKVLYEQGLEAAELAAGEKMLAEAEGSFWEYEQTRAYLRARMGLAVVLRAIGEEGEAIYHAEEILRLNPSDEQGVRFWLFGWLVRQGNTSEADALLGHYEDDTTAQWAYARLLLLLLAADARTRAGEEGAKAAEAALRDALRKNPLVPAYLLWEAAPAATRLDNPYKRTVMATSAAECAEVLREAWEASPEALGRLRGLWRRTASRSHEGNGHSPA